MIRILIIGIIMASSQLIVAQNYIPYYNLVNEAEYAVFQNNYATAVQKYEAAFKLEEPLAKDAYLLAYCLDNIDTTSFRNRIEELLIDASENNGTIAYWMKLQPLSISFEKEFYSKLQSNEVVCDSIARSINDTIDYFEQKDQEVRRLIADSIAPYYDEGSTVYEEYITKMSLNDSIYQTQFLRYIKTQGYPGIKRSGTNIAGMLLLHIHPSLFEDYRSVLLEELKTGNIDPFIYGSMVDRINCIVNDEAFYYAYNVGAEHCQPSSTEAITNRISIGMSPYFNGTRRYVEITKDQLLKLP